MFVILPYDPSTKFLKEITKNIQHLISGKVDDCMPENHGNTIDNIISQENSKTILFLGHGYSGGIYGGCYVAGTAQPLLRMNDGVEILKEKKIILLSCRSEEYIATIESAITAGLGFGNIITSKSDLLTQKEKKKFRDITAINIFRSALLDVFSKSMIEACENNYTFLELYLGLKLRINKKICHYSLSADENEKLAGELFFILRKEMKLFGDTNAYIL